MKKLMTMVLAGALMFAMAGQAQATALETSGELRARGWFLNNYITTGKTLEMWDQRLRLNLDWAVAENVKIHVRADVLEGLWGYSSTLTNNLAGGVANTTTQQITFDHANMTFLWPDTPLTFVVGRQDVSWGTGYDTQADYRDRFKVSAKFGDITTALIYDKFTEVFLDHAAKDDNRAWQVAAVIPAGAFKVGATVGYVMDATRPAAAPDADKTFIKANAWTMGKVADVELKGEFTYISGNSGVKLADGSKQKLTGMGLYVGASMPVGPVKLGLEGAYAQGNDPKTAGTNEGAFKSDYNGPFWSVIFYQNMDYPGVGANPQTSDSGGDTSVTNAMAGKLSAVMSPMKGLTAIANILLVSADKVAAGVSKAMGTEIDLVFVYGISDNVSLTAGVGYALLGDYWKGQNGAAAGKSPANPIGSVASFNVKF